MRIGRPDEGREEEIGRERGREERMEGVTGRWTLERGR